MKTDSAVRANGNITSVIDLISIQACGTDVNLRIRGRFVTFVIEEESQALECKRTYFVLKRSVYSFLLFIQVLRCSTSLRHISNLTYNMR